MVAARLPQLWEWAEYCCSRAKGNQEKGKEWQ